MEEKGQVRIRLKLKKGVLLKILLVLVVIFCVLFYIFNLRIKNIYISGNETIKDVQIIDALDIGDYPKIYSLNTKKMVSELESMPLINKASIKRNIFGRLDIKISEETLFFYYRYNNSYVTSLGNFVNEGEYYGYPTLINFTPDTVFERLVEGFNKVDIDIIRQINEIEYNPYMASDGSIVDDGRFILKMNDGNQVLIDIVNIRNLNDYNKIYISIGMDEVKGTLYLDTITDGNIYFKSYQELPADEVVEKKEENKETGEKPSTEGQVANTNGNQVVGG